MAVELIFAPEVEQDIEEAYQWYEDRRIGLGEEFLSCVEAGIQYICRLPKGTAQAISLRDILRVQKEHGNGLQCFSHLPTP